MIEALLLSKNTLSYIYINVNMEKVKKLKEKDKKLRNWFVRGGRDNSKKDFLTLLKRAVSA